MSRTTEQITPGPSALGPDDKLVIHSSAPDAVAWIGPQGQLMLDAIYQAWSESIGKDEAHKWRPLKLMHSDAQ